MTPQIVQGNVPHPPSHPPPHSPLPPHPPHPPPHPPSTPHPSTQSQTTSPSSMQQVPATAQAGQQVRAPQAAVAVVQGTTAARRRTPPTAGWQQQVSLCTQQGSNAILGRMSAAQQTAARLGRNLFVTTLTHDAHTQPTRSLFYRVSKEGHILRWTSRFLEAGDFKLF